MRWWAAPSASSTTVILGASSFFFFIFGCWCGAGAPSTSRRQLVPDPVDIFSKVRPSVRVFASFLYSTWNRESPPTPISFSPAYFDCFSLLSSLVCICRGETHHSLNYSIREPWFFFAFKSLASCCVSSHSTAVHSYFLFLFWEPTLSKIFQKNKNFQHFSHSERKFVPLRSIESNYNQIKEFPYREDAKERTKNNKIFQIKENRKWPIPTRIRSDMLEEDGCWSFDEQQLYNTIHSDEVKSNRCAFLLIEY